jgi:hypothetical protein
LRAAPAWRARSTASSRTNGSDTGNDCLTSTAPCRGIAYAVAQALSGDTIKIGGGLFPTAISLAASTVLTIEGGYADDFASRDLKDFRTSLDGGSTQVLALAAGTGAAIAVSVDGVTMRRAKIPGGNGGAVNAVQSGSGTLSVTLSRTVLMRHQTGSGGGVYIEFGRHRQRRADAERLEHLRQQGGRRRRPLCARSGSERPDRHPRDTRSSPGTRSRAPRRSTPKRPTTRPSPRR